MAANECIPYWDRADAVTCLTTAAVTGKRFVKISATRGTDGHPKVAHAGAGEPVFGVAAYDAAITTDVTVIHDPSLIVPVTAGGSITAGTAVVSDATGRAVAAGAAVVGIGIALDTVTVGQDCPIDRTVRAVGA